MTKELRVIDPFFILEVDDTLIFDEKIKKYVVEKNEEMHTSLPDSDGEYSSTCSSRFVVSPDWAKQLIKDGYLEEVSEKPTKDTNFVNVFDEIDSLIKKYQTEIDSIGEDMKDAPECLKVERTTVLTNILNVLKHLKKLRK